MKSSKGNSISTNIFHLLYSTALTSALNAGSLILLAYYLQSYSYGLFSVVLAFAMIMAYFTDAGLSDIVLREGSRKGVDIPSVISSYIKMRALLLLVTFIIGFLIIEILHSDNTELVRTAYFLVIPMVTGVAMQSIGITYFQLKEKMQYCGIIRITSSTCLVTSIMIGMLFSISPITVSFLYGCSYLTAGVIGISLLCKNMKIVWRGKFHKGLLHKLGSFTLGGLLFVLLPHLGPLVLERTLTLQEVGLFAVAYRIPQALQQIPFIVAGAYYPVLFRYFNHKQLKEHLALLITQTKIMALIGITMTIPFYYLSSSIISLLFGESWLEAAILLKVLSILLTLQAINISLADGLTTSSRQIFRTSVQLVAVIIGIFLYTINSNNYGLIGAAVAGLTIEVIALTGFWIFLSGKWLVAKSVLVPYLTVFVTTFILLEYFLQPYPILAMTMHLSSLLLFILFDRELKEKFLSLVKRTLQNKWFNGNEKERGVGNG
ncbi:oligosaccharide flippase family protein [Sutcliffiella horikoshii]|uniref:Oligosaccharide flippase family protein n=1 Tax=Sutcliffiella horikoshii TaxID=79883 RepID=A0A5D4SY78_9BACI|nr:oligosaccharide flippase family protein [Sutcliffiella horikoshii]TYS67172.1 oligosaccharide flippase family protein [Sutcliffiella horikoshii]